MRRRGNTRAAVVSAGLAAGMAALGWCRPAEATFHLWQVSEVYSDAGGTVQFIEFFNVANIESFLTISGGLTSNSMNYTFTSDLPSTTTANTHMLVGSTAYAALTGAPDPDYVIPNHFFSVAGDTLTLVGADNGSITFTGVQLPTDGTNSLNRAYNGSTTTGFTTTINSPTNFAGETGTVPEPAAAALILLSGLCWLAARPSR